MRSRAGRRPPRRARAARRRAGARGIVDRSAARCRRRSGEIVGAKLVAEPIAARARACGLAPPATASCALDRPARKDERVGRKGAAACFGASDRPRSGGRARMTVAAKRTSLTRLVVSRHAVAKTSRCELHWAAIWRASSRRRSTGGCARTITRSRVSARSRRKPTMRGRRSAREVGERRRPWRGGVRRALLLDRHRRQHRREQGARHSSGALRRRGDRRGRARMERRERALPEPARDLAPRWPKRCSRPGSPAAPDRRTRPIAR